MIAPFALFPVPNPEMFAFADLRDVAFAPRGRTATSCILSVSFFRFDFRFDFRRFDFRGMGEPVTMCIGVLTVNGFARAIPQRGIPRHRII